MPKMCIRDSFSGFQNGCIKFHFKQQIVPAHIGLYADAGHDGEATAQSYFFVVRGIILVFEIGYGTDDILPAHAAEAVLGALAVYEQAGVALALRLEGTSGCLGTLDAWHEAMVEASAELEAAEREKRHPSLDRLYRCLLYTSHR